MFASEDNVFLNEYRVLTRIVTLICVLSLFFVWYRKWMNGEIFKRTLDAAGKVAIVIGDTNIGYAISLGLARHGVRVILACAEHANAEKIRQRIIAESGNDRIECMHLDLTSFQSVRTFVDEVKATDIRLNYLVHAHTDVLSEKRLIVDKYQFAVGSSFFGKFLLSFLLLPILRQSRPSRIVFISNWLHRFYANECLRALGVSGFCQSSAATILGARGMSNCLFNSGVTCNIVDPGASIDDLEMLFGCLKRIPVFIKNQLNDMLLRSVRTRAQAVLRIVLDFNWQNVTGTHYTGNRFPSAHNDEIANSVLNSIERVLDTKISQ